MTEQPGARASTFLHQYVIYTHGVCEVHVNTMAGFWSLLRSWLRPHRGISQEKLSLYLGFFEFVHNVRKRGKALLGALIELLVT
jgi:transposase